MIDWKNYYRQEPMEADIYFKFVCFYQAVTELYDRTLTDLRSPYDETEAYFGGRFREYKRHSDLYSERLYNQIVKYAEQKTNQLFDVRRWKNVIRQRYSAQGWIDVFEHLKSENDEIILDMIENILNKKRRNERKNFCENSILK